MFSLENCGAQSSVEQSVVVKKPSLILVSLKAFLNLSGFQIACLSSISKPSRNSLERFSFLASMSLLSKGLLIHGSPRPFWPQKGFPDIRVFLSLPSGWDFRRLCLIRLGMWVCFSNSNSPLWKRILVSWREASLGQEMDFERGLVCFSDFFEVTIAQTLRKSLFMLSAFDHDYGSELTHVNEGGRVLYVPLCTWP